MAKEVKENRVIGGRSAERRDQEISRLKDMDYRNPLYFPPEYVPDGMEYAWGTYSLLNVPRPSRMMELRQKGWEPVPADRHPDLAFAEFVESNAQMRGHIWRDGLILIERPEEYGDIEREQLEAKNYQTLVSMPGTEDFLGGAQIPTNFKGETWLSKGKQASFGT